MSHLSNEIHEQPEVAARLLREQSARAGEIAEAIRQFKPAFVWIAARGTSDNAARYAQYLWGTHARLAVGLATPSVHTLYNSSPDLSRALVLGISQSGQSEDVRRVLADAREQGALTVSITNDSASPLAQIAAYHLPLLAGKEHSIAATKTYTAELVAVALIGAALIGETAFDHALHSVPEIMSETLAANADSAWVERYRYMERYAVIGRGYNYCTAIEISLKIKELCAIPGEEYSEADFRHGPIAVVKSGFPVILVAPQGNTFAKQYDLLERLHGTGAECLVVSNAPETGRLARRVLPIPAHVPEWLSPLVAVLPGQMFAMALAGARGLNIDQPVGLTKVTVTE
ncbi:MAG: SIS domain-containing protein [Anaerolinea sp.]|nr:SIS domain-containing protein [Anaerolinea sp.]